jgi:hypothetical protein
MTDAETPLCGHKERLLRAYGSASGDYHRAISVLIERAGVLQKPDYERLRNFVGIARTALEQAREAVDHHTSEHGC